MRCESFSFYSNNRLLKTSAPKYLLERFLFGPWLCEMSVSTKLYLNLIFICSLKNKLMRLSICDDPQLYIIKNCTYSLRMTEIGIFFQFFNTNKKRSV